jgi:hypothetical protein
MNRAWIAAALATPALLTGCTTYAQPDTALKGVSYTGGDWDSKAFLKCVEPGSNEAVDNGGDTYYYPITTRTYVFSNLHGADAPPIGVSTSNNQELQVGGTITFTLDTSCDPWDEMNPDPDGPGPLPAPGTVKKHWPGGKLQAFHDTIGRSKGAFFTEESTVVPPGWVDAMNIYLGGPANRTMDQVGGGYTWQDLYSDKAKTGLFIDAVKNQIPAQIAALTGGAEFYKVTDIQLDKPEVSGELKTQMERAEASALARTNAQADVDFAARFPGGSAAYQAWKDQQSLAQLRDAQARCFNEARCNAVPVGVSG